MALRVKLPVVTSRTAFAAGGVFSPEVIAQEFSRMAAVDIADKDKANEDAAGRALPFKTFVDGSERTPLPDSIDAKCIISARWDVGSGVVQYAWDLVHSAGPVKTGAYRKSARLFADGAEVQSPDETTGAKEVIIVATVPYARKIERGKGGYSPGAVYEAVAALVKQKFSNAAQVKFSYRPISDIPGLEAYATKTLAAKRLNPGRTAKEHARLIRQPVILIVLE